MSVKLHNNTRTMEETYTANQKIYLTHRNLPNAERKSVQKQFQKMGCQKN